MQENKYKYLELVNICKKKIIQKKSLKKKDIKLGLSYDCNLSH